MLGAFLIYLTALAPLQNHTHTGDDRYYVLPRFWTSSGFCPAGAIDHKSIAATLLSDAVQMNLRQIAALPTGALTHVRIHWLLELIQFVQYTQEGVPIYDFSQLDTFMWYLDELGLYPVLEFMANPGDVFSKNPNRNDFLWEDFSYQVTKHYLNLLGAAKLLRWRFESWNEPDSHNYNRLNFTVEDYNNYTVALRRGLTDAGRRPSNSLHFKLRGPAGLFKSTTHHPLCWGILAACNAHPEQCPFEVLTYHRKGDGRAAELLETSRQLLQKIFITYPNIQTLPISNDEADPIVGWSTPQPFHEDVRYAVKLLTIVLAHWHAKLENDEFKMLESLSHDNAFLSYHPYEFSQRTLLAHFRMNNTAVVHSQFVQKPVYAALGMLSKLAPLAADVEVITAPNTTAHLWLLKSTNADNHALYLSWLLLPSENATYFGNFTLHRQLPFQLCAQETFVYALEMLEQRHTDPAFIWRAQGDATPYPNATLRAAMRRAQTPRLQATGILKASEMHIALGEFAVPWVILFRVCSNLMPALKQPQELTITAVTVGEVLITWHELVNTTQCLKSYEVWQQRNETADWQIISDGWHLPFPSFQYAPAVDMVNGFYKVRGVDLFNIKSKFSTVMEYIEV